MKRFSGIGTCAAIVAATGFFASPLVALSTTESQALTKTVIDTRAAELPDRATKLVAKASKEERDAVAGIVVSATAWSHPAALVSTVSAVVRKFPETSVAVVNAAIDAAPDQATATVAAVVKAAPSQAESVVLAASKKAPDRAAAFERQAAYLGGSNARKARSITAASTTITQVGTPIGQTPMNVQTLTPIGPLPTNLYAQPGSDPSRP